ncbi:bifunctional diaminohydroxyphosphoribosylaminopyrimidine deaminase/5-amino-6-(5-phosphoribosylamino)uracil reductase RibD [Candidatus Sumerlaeota bacterium]|nr:bifunctional diaminohydroxyphosphoribosylaminopyrimidine deaminase/5-amino-6-(5-phosphoribosylamino)uracil reductase RibD [Candidatus Sumerlaeota bacterium]
MGISARDRQFMHLALELAERARGQTSPNPMVGAVIVQGDEIVGQGYHQRAGEPHAEIVALREAGERARGATLYMNLEPCCHQGRTPPCTETILRAGIARVVAAMMDPNPLVNGGGFRRLRVAGVEVDFPVLEGEARRLNEAFLTYHLLKRPFTIAKWAMTLDGRTSTDAGDSRWISNDASREYAHEIRASVDAIAVGVGTILADNPKLNVRLKEYERKQPARIVFDGRLRIPLGARCLDPSGGQAIVVASTTAPKERVDRLKKAGHKVLLVPGKKRFVDIGAALEILAGQGILSVLVEGGRELHTSLLREGLADKIVVFVGPRIIGGVTSNGPVTDLGIARLRAAMTLKNVRIRTFGTDACIEGYANLLPKE